LMENCGVYDDQRTIFGYIVYEIVYEKKSEKN